MTGTGLVLVALATNPWVLERYVVPDGAISTKTAAFVVALELVLLAAGAWLIRRNDSAPLSSLVLAGVASLLTLVGAEFYLRLIPAYRPPVKYYRVGGMANRPSRHFEVDSLTGWRLRPNHSFTWTIAGTTTTVASNAQGMRAPADYNTTCGRPRVALIGDSFAFGTGVEYAQSVGAQLEDSLAHGVEVYDLAMPGFAIDQMWMTLRHRALALCPAVLVVMFVDDDFNRSLTAYRDGEGMNKPMFVLDHDTLRQATPADRPSPADLLLRGLSLARLVRLALHYEHSVRSEWWLLNSAMLDAMRRDAAAAGVPLLFVRVPRKDAWRDFASLAVFMASRHAGYLDLAAPRLQRGDVHFATDGHLNARGDAWVAGAVAAWIRHQAHVASL